MGSTDEETQTGLLGGELGALAQTQAEAAQPPNVAYCDSLQANISTCLDSFPSTFPLALTLDGFPLCDHIWSPAYSWDPMGADTWEGCRGNVIVVK